MRRLFFTQQRKDDDERVSRAAQLLVKSPILSVPQVSRYFVMIHEKKL